MSSRHNAISIDLGTTHARVAVFQNDRVHVLVDGGGRCSTPSCVAFTESEIIVGEAALGQITSNVDNTVFNVKRIIGRDLDSQEVQDEAQAFPFKIIAKDGRGPFIQVAFKGNKNTFSPEQICAMLLTKMKEIAEAHLRTDVTTAVITVPDCFNSAQIQATRMAGEIAGLQVLRIMTETSAAAFTYGHSAYKMGSGERNILIFDLGGGHLSVCLVNIDDGILDVKAAAGDAHLGGEDFDNRLVSWCVQEFKLKHHEDLSGNNRALRRLRTACERAKRTLSSVTETTIEVDALFQGTDFYTKITRAKFEELCVDLFRGTIDPVERVLRDSHISKDSVHEVVLVGGSTRIPKVCQLLQDFFNGKELNRSINPEEAVAYGAAVQAAMLSGEQFKSVQDMMLLAVASISIGIETASGVMAKITDRNSTIPCLQERTFFTCSDKQTRGLLRLLEGECDMAKDNRILGEFHIDGIPPAPPGLLLHVRIDLDANGVEGLLATDKESWGDQKLSVSKIHHDLLLRDGAPVIVHGLTSKPELSSCFGVCERFDDEDGLWVVRLDTNDTVKLYPKNLAVRRLLPPMQDMKLEALTHFSPHLLKLIENSHPAHTEILIYDHKFKAGECESLALALSLNTCIVSFRLHCCHFEGRAFDALLPALTHLPTLTELDLVCNLTADDGVHILAAAAAAGMTQLQRLYLSDRARLSPPDVVECREWNQLNLPLPPDEIVSKCSFHEIQNSPHRRLIPSFLYSPLLSYLLSDKKVAAYSIRLFLIGESTAGKTSLVRALMSPSSTCASIDLDDRTVGIDRYEMQLYHSVASSFGTSSSFPQPSPPSIHTSSMSQPLQDGAGSYKFPDGSLYQGEWRDLRPYGTGCMHHCDGSIYEGRFVAGMRHGKGILKFSSDGERNGYTWKAGDVYDGHWKRDVRHGDCEYTWFNGETLKCRWVDGKSTEWSLKNAEIIGSAIDVQMWDLAGQDVYMLSHAVHFSHRCIYLLLWKPFECLATTMQRLSPWLESLCMHVPDARIVLVASHCKTNVRDDEFTALSREVETAVLAKIQELNDITRLEVDRLRTLFIAAEKTKQRLQDSYGVHASSSPEYAKKDGELLKKVGLNSGCLEAWAARAAASVDDLPLSLRTRAAAVHDAIVQENLLCDRLQLLLGIRNGARPDGRVACKLTLHCKSVDSVHGYGISEFRSWLYHHCRSMPFMGEMISSDWTAIANGFKHFGDSVLSRADGIAMARQHLPPSISCRWSDDSIWKIIEFWSLVGRIFVYESHVVREPSTLIALLKPLLHHEPLQMMRIPGYQNLLVDESLQSSATRSELEAMLQNLKLKDEASLKLLDHLRAWKELSDEQRSSMLAFFERSRLLCQVSQRPEVRFISSRVRAKPHLTSEAEHVTAVSMYHVLYLLPLNHIGIIAHLQAEVSSAGLQFTVWDCQSGRDSLLLRRSGASQCSCMFTVDSFSGDVEQSARFSTLCGLLGESFSCVLRIACTDFGMLKFASQCADKALDSCSFGSRFQCWLTVVDSATIISGGQWIARKWIKFRDAVSSTLNKLSLGDALQLNHHEKIIPGQSIIELFQPHSSIFVSHAWGDGTGVFIQRLKTHFEHQTLTSVWVDQDGLNQQVETLIPSFRAALCQARIVLVALTPTYLTRPNCLRELRWALDFERAGHLKVLLLALHPAVTFDGRLQLVQNGPLRGLVFSSKEKKVKRLCPEALALVERLNDVHMNMLPWHELQAWRSDELKGDWEEHRWYDSNGTVKRVHLAGCQDGLVEQTISGISDYLPCVSPRPASECAAMDDTAALSAHDVPAADVPSDFIRIERYPESDARAAAKEVVLSRQLQPGDEAWEQDSSRVSCPGPSCGKRFGFLNRRHHCRFCGSVMCGLCAPALERFGSHVNVRCCLKCRSSGSGQPS